MIVRMFAPDDNALRDKLGQFAAYRRARTVNQQKELFQRQWLPPLFCISDLDDDIEIDDGFEERELLPFKRSDLS